jgi:hypothetical protein
VNHTIFSGLTQREGPDPAFGWPLVVVTGKRYRFHWGEGIDFMNMKLEIKDYSWEETDLNVHMMTNFTDVRMSINATG